MPWPVRDGRIRHPVDPAFTVGANRQGRPLAPEAGVGTAHVACVNGRPLSRPGETVGLESRLWVTRAGGGRSPSRMQKVANRSATRTESDREHDLATARRGQANPEPTASTAIRHVSSARDGSHGPKGGAVSGRDLRAAGPHGNDGLQSEAPESAAREPARGGHGRRTVGYAQCRDRQSLRPRLLYQRQAPGERRGSCLEYAVTGSAHQCPPVGLRHSSADTDRAWGPHRSRDGQLVLAGLQSPGRPGRAGPRHRLGVLGEAAGGFVAKAGLPDAARPRPPRTADCLRPVDTPFCAPEPEADRALSMAARVPS